MSKNEFLSLLEDVDQCTSTHKVLFNESPVKINSYQIQQKQIETGAIYSFIRK